jgi:hypothetical protein
VNDPRRSGPWSPTEVRAFLDTSLIPMRLAANTGSGFPVLLSLWFNRDDDDLLAAVHRDAKIVKRLTDDPRCAFEIATNDPPYRGVRGQARATLDSEGAAELLERLITRYLGTTESKLGRFLMSRADEELIVRLRPRSIASWDYTERMQDASRS